MIPVLAKIALSRVSAVSILLQNMTVSSRSGKLDGHSPRSEDLMIPARSKRSLRSSSVSGNDVIIPSKTQTISCICCFLSRISFSIFACSIIVLSSSTASLFVFIFVTRWYSTFGAKPLARYSPSPNRTWDSQKSSLVRLLGVAVTGIIIGEWLFLPLIAKVSITWRKSLREVTLCASSIMMISITSISFARFFSWAVWKVLQISSSFFRPFCFEKDSTSMLSISENSSPFCLILSAFEWWVDTRILSSTSGLRIGGL